MWDIIAVLLPSVCVGAIFYFVMKAVFNADRSERKALAEMERLEDLKGRSEKNQPE